MVNDEHLHKAFAFLDINKSGYLEKEDLRDALNDEVDPCSEEVINAIMHDDGRISYEEFAAMMKAGSGHLNKGTNVGIEREKKGLLVGLQVALYQDLLEGIRIFEDVADSKVMLQSLEVAYETTFFLGFN
ncbi:hypothetical protein J1N35_025873 [Gossypium stocksii]|uniref:EF-hand domain-containing protein n=1 Tax=Gossypium stocksii TaxID=47602 RepID=A0A9D3ZWL5_9ROSI|nr:hypothetical protein J1N35_025873 [Gossypium stocksii]